MRQKKYTYRIVSIFSLTSVRLVGIFLGNNIFGAIYESISPFVESYFESINLNIQEKLTQKFIKNDQVRENVLKCIFKDKSGQTRCLFSGIFPVNPYFISKDIDFLAIFENRLKHFGIKGYFSNKFFIYFLQKMSGINSQIVEGLNFYICSFNFQNYLEILYDYLQFWEKKFLEHNLNDFAQKIVLYKKQVYKIILIVYPKLVLLGQNLYEEIFGENWDASNQLLGNLYGELLSEDFQNLFHGKMLLFYAIHNNIIYKNFNFGTLKNRK